MEFNPNNTFMYVVVTLVIIFVLLQSVVFFIKAWKRGKELGMDMKALKKPLAHPRSSPSRLRLRFYLVWSR
jgi:hypothetical protein